MIDSSCYDPASPKAIEEIVGNSDAWKEFAKLIRTNSASHTILVGPAGCGKSLFLRLALSGFLTLSIDCTANFGLRDVRDSIRIFARGSRSPGGNLRWIIFEHADALTSDAQAFLRRMLETTSATTRIVFECRDAGAISEPIVSRSAIVSVNAPEDTEMTYEILRRTEFKLRKEDAEEIVRYSFGNMRAAMLSALVMHRCGIQNSSYKSVCDELLAERPTSASDETAWIEWACKAESTCKLHGIDLRDVLRLGWPTSPAVSHTCQQWSRLGGTSPRTLFFRCIFAVKAC